MILCEGLIFIIFLFGNKNSSVVQINAAKDNILQHIIAIPQATASKEGCQLGITGRGDKNK
jgi:hypothetical protein